MKKFRYIGILLLLVTISAAYGQDGQPEPRRTAAEQVAFEKSVPVNPAKIQVITLVDPKMDNDLGASGPVNWKPGEIPDNDSPVIESQPAMESMAHGQIAAPGDVSQPEGAKSQSEVISRRNIQGTDTQPDAPKPENVTNFRELKGTSDAQPEGEKPKR